MNELDHRSTSDAGPAEPLILAPAGANPSAAGTSPAGPLCVRPPRRASDSAGTRRPARKSPPKPTAEDDLQRLGDPPVRSSQPRFQAKAIDGGPSDERERTKEPVALYALDEVKASLGMKNRIRASAQTCDEDTPPTETEHQTRLGEILGQGEQGRWRHALGPHAGSHDAIGALDERAPHLAELSDLVRMNLRAAGNMGGPIFLNPVLLLGPPGVGKTWFLSRLATSLGVPFRSYAMSSATLGDGLQGGHPSWRNAEPGLVAKTLLRETAANPILYIDEFDKAQSGSWNVDPYRPFYTLLDPSGSRRFTDEYLGFPIDASKVLWVMAANDCSRVPAPIMDRLTVLEVPDMTVGQRIAVVESVYAEANAVRRQYFEDHLPVQVVERLAAMTPRSMRIALEDAMARAASEARRSIAERDVRDRRGAPKWRAGFR